MYKNKIAGGARQSGSMVMPPPNVTGVLHLGHALNLFTQSALVLFYKQQGFEITWIPGTDHAGIATQLLVQNQLRDQGITLNGEDLEKKIWEWARYSESSICGQLKEMGLPLDWDKYTFSLDEHVQNAVRETFCRLYEKGLIFRAKRMVNWDIKLQTVISDIEAQGKELDGQMHYIRYGSADGDEIVVGTTRPETIFADEAISVNPEDERYKGIVGKEFRVPLVDRLVPIVTDKNCDPELGTGALKIDPAHGFLDFEIGQKYNLPIYEVIDRQGKMCGPVPEELKGVDRFEARKIVVEMLRKSGDLVKSEDIKHTVTHGIRSDVVLEPVLSDQWFFDISKLKDGALEALNKIDLHPARFKSIYKHYVNNLQPWCISRQIIWGHKIPAWYDENGEIYVAKTEDDAQKLAGNKRLTRDSDVLDTWFSSALWPMINAGWPDKMDSGYPNFALVTGSDILFFWVLKMILMPVALGEEEPFKNVMLHGLVQDAFGLKMSKSKGNVVEPISFVREYGADVLCFALLSASVAGNNVRFGKPSIEMAKKFLTKINNAMSYCSNITEKKYSKKKSHPINHWILSLIQKTEDFIQDSVLKWDLYHAAIEIYRFFWDDFCSWYIECSKILLKNEFHEETVSTIDEACQRILKIMHPFLPQTTLKYWPTFSGKEITDEIEKSTDIDKNNNFHDIQKIINLIRSIKSIPELVNDVPIKNVHVSPNLDKVYKDVIESLATVKISIVEVTCEVKFASSFSFLESSSSNIPSENSPSIILGFPELKLKQALPVIKKIVAKLESELLHLQSRLEDPGFLKNAEESDVFSKKQRLSALREEISVYKSILQN